VDETIPFTSTLPSIEEKDIDIVEQTTSAIYTIACSAECTEALSAIATDPWDISSWIIYLEEVEQGRGGTNDLNDAYNRLLTQFPRSAKFWKKYIEFNIPFNESKKIEELFNQCIEKCRSIELWELYLSFIKNTSIKSSQNAQPEQIDLKRKKIENAYEKAIANIGMAFNSYSIWKEYINFIRSWPEISVGDAGRKLNTLRKIYQFALTIPMEQLDDIWNEYELFEKQINEQYEIILQDWNKKFLHAKSIYKERKKFTNLIVFDRFATFPTFSSIEMQQLDHWNAWLK
jgi:cleavage stimulation factor subunit 3